MALPVTPVSETGTVLDALTGGQAKFNALSEQALKNKMQALQNQYYPTDIQSQINYRNALTSKVPGEIQHQNLINKYYGPNILSEIANRNALTSRVPFENRLSEQQIREAMINNQTLDELNRAKIANMQAMASNRQMAGAGKGSVDFQNIDKLKRQVQFENPDFTPQEINEAAGAYLAGKNTLSTGKQLKQSDLIDTMVPQINKKNSTSAIQNTAANLDVTADELNKNIDVEAISKFAGPLGRINYANERAKMIYDPTSVSEDFRKYKEYQDVISTFAMDTLRKGFGTSVVPDYVYQTLGKAQNPQSDFWNDPTQVARDLNRVKKWVNDSARSYKTKALKGATANIENVNAEPKKSDISDEDINFTAKKYNISPEEVRRKLGI